LIEILKERADLIEELGPLVGVWWYWNGQIVDFSDMDGRSEGGYLTYVRDHSQLWPRMIIKFPELSTYKYYDIPRGRVVKNKSTGVYEIWGNPEIIDYLLDDLVKLYNLTNYVVSDDIDVISHYTGTWGPTKEILKKSKGLM
jgi:hypothetical protein